jgi:hypothetical protein
MKLTFSSFFLALFIAAIPNALASNTWYVNGVTGSDSNNCMTATTACKTIGHAISLASSGDSIMVAAATYTENLNANISLNIVGAGASTTIIDGGRIDTALTTRGGGMVSGVTIRNGFGHSRSGCGGLGGGICALLNMTTSMTIQDSVITGNLAQVLGGGVYSGGGGLTIVDTTVSENIADEGGGVYFVGNTQASGTLTINESTISGNTSRTGGGGFSCFDTTMAISNSTVRGNSAAAGTGGGGEFNCSGTIDNSTLSGNAVNGSAQEEGLGGGLWSAAITLLVNNATISGNSASVSGGGIYLQSFPSGFKATATLQNTIVANSVSGGDCGGGGTLISNGYNLSGDSTCSFTGPGDLNNTNPMLGPLQNNGGPTKTMALLPGSPAIDAGNPSGCTDGRGHLLTTDQRGAPRPDKDDTSGCDMGAYESQN